MELLLASKVSICKAKIYLLCKKFDKVNSVGECNASYKKSLIIDDMNKLLDDLLSYINEYEDERKSILMQSSIQERKKYIKKKKDVLEKWCNDINNIIR
jgi:hypothetical protein